MWSEQIFLLTTFFKLPKSVFQNGIFAVEWRAEFQDDGSR
jgi:hypothetical protein